MSSVPGIIQSSYESLTPAQRRLADHVLANQGEIPFMTSREMAAGAEVSVASISRFVQALGFESFREFKARLGRESLSGFEGVYQAVESRDTDERVVEKVFSGSIRSLDETLRLLDLKQVVEAARIIGKCRKAI